MDKFPLKLTKEFGPNESTRWMNTDCVRWVDCPKCGVSAGFSCETPGGRKYANGPHGDRLQNFYKDPKWDIDNYRMKSCIKASHVLGFERCDCFD